MTLFQIPDLDSIIQQLDQVAGQIRGSSALLNLASALLSSGMLACWFCVLRDVQRAFVLVLWVWLLGSTSKLLGATLP